MSEFNSNYVGLATMEVGIYNVMCTPYKDKQTGEDKILYRAVTDLGVITVSEQVGEKLLKASVQTPSTFILNSYVKDGVVRYTIS